MVNGSNRKIEKGTWQKHFSAPIVLAAFRLHCSSFNYLLFQWPTNFENIFQGAFFNGILETSTFAYISALIAVVCTVCISIYLIHEYSSITLSSLQWKKSAAPFYLNKKKYVVSKSSVSFTMDSRISRSKKSARKIWYSTIDAEFGLKWRNDYIFCGWTVEINNAFFPRRMYIQHIFYQQIDTREVRVPGAHSGKSFSWNLEKAMINRWNIHFQSLEMLMSIGF